MPQIFKITIPKSKHIKILYPVITMRNCKICLSTIGPTRPFSEILAGLESLANDWIRTFSGRAITELTEHGNGNSELSKSVSVNSSIRPPTAVFILSTKKDETNLDDWTRWYKDNYVADEFYHFKVFQIPKMRPRLMLNCRPRDDNGSRAVQELLAGADSNFVRNFMNTAPFKKKNYLLEGFNKDQIQKLTKGFKENSFDIRVYLVGFFEKS